MSDMSIALHRRGDSLWPIMIDAPWQKSTSVGLYPLAHLMPHIAQRRLVHVRQVVEGLSITREMDSTLGKRWPHIESLLTYTVSVTPVL